MIPVLYKANATDFTTYGIGVLKDCTSCEVTEERNGAFECVLKYPITGAMYKEITLERLVKAKPNDTANDQVFRIYRVTTPINGQVTVYAQHISYDLSNVAALQWETESISPQLAMERVFQNTAAPHNFTCQTEYSVAKAFSVKKPQSVRACLGGVAGSFLDLWGGEYEWDNFKVIHHQGRGQHTGVVIEYGKNLTELESIEEAVNVWRWNVGGLGFSSNGYNGPYETAITADGQIVADFITSGTLVANIIKAGVLQSQDGSSYWDLETGEVVLRAYATTETVDKVSDRITTIEDQKMYRLVISSSNGNIFKNGNIQTTLYATVFSWDENVTDTLDENQFIWTRVSEDAVADEQWNADHFGGSKSIDITTDDVKVRATFFCDLIDTATRTSLLG